MLQFLIVECSLTEALEHFTCGTSVVSCAACKYKRLFGEQLYLNVIVFSGRFLSRFYT